VFARARAVPFDRVLAVLEADARLRNRPTLYVVSDRFALPDITEAAWLAGLRDRLAAAGLTVSDDALLALLAGSKCHPLCTMHAAKETYLAATADEALAVELVHVEAGLAQSRQQLWWKEFTGE
jgi:hypothetical protein